MKYKTKWLKNIKSYGDKTGKTITEEIIFVKRHLFHQSASLQKKKNDRLFSCFRHFDHDSHKLCESTDIAFVFRSEPSINIFLKVTKTIF